MTDRERSAVLARINPDFDPVTKHKILKDYEWATNREPPCSDEDIKRELQILKGKISHAVFHGDPTLELLIRREVLYLIAEERGLF